jgi:hypothetical protein
VENAVLSPDECAFLNCQVVDDVDGMDFNTGIREGGEPTAEKPGAGCFSLAVDTAWRLKNDVVGKDFRKPIKVMGVEGGPPLRKLRARSLPFDPPSDCEVRTEGSRQKAMLR